MCCLWQAGGRRFYEAGYVMPKPLIEAHGIPMIKLVVDNLTPRCEHRFIFVAQREHIDAYNLSKQLKSYAKNVEIIAVDAVTQGQACSIVLTKAFVNNDDSLMTANSDQYIDIDINDYLYSMQQRKLDGLIMTMHSQDPKWSYAKLNDQNMVIATAEKSVISNNATVGIFNFRKGSDFVRAAEQMLSDDLRVGGEFYSCPAYNYLIAEGKNIGIYSIGEEYNGMYGLGIPQDLEFFLNHKISKRIREQG